MAPAGGVLLSGEDGRLATLALNAGEISGNDARSGGGVAAKYDTLTMSGGIISGNTAGGGGGLFLYETGTATMSGGEISGNISSYSGGGVSAGGSFTLTAGKITGNTAAALGGGVYYMSKTDGSVSFVMNGGEISANIAPVGSGTAPSDMGTPVFEMNGGVIYGPGATTAAITAPETWAPENTGTGMVVCYSGASGSNYNVLTTTNLTTSPSGASAHWSVGADDAGGITYTNGANTGFIPVAGVTVNRLVLTATNLTYSIPTGHVYTGAQQAGIGTVSGPSGFDSTTGGTITVLYNGSATVPTNAGSYTVTATISGGSVYQALTGTSALSLGTYTVGKKALTITGAAIDAKTYDGTTAATVNSVTLSGDVDGMALGTDFTATGAFNSANVADASSVTVTVTLGDTAATNYALASSTYPLAGQSISKAATGLTGSVPGGTIIIVGTNTSPNTLDLSTAISLAPTSPGQTGTVSYALGAFTDGTGILTGPPSLSGTNNATLNYTGTGQTTGTATQELTITTANYDDITVTLTFEASDKLPATVTVTAPANITYGQTLASPSATASAGGSSFTYSYTGTIEGGATYNPTATPPTKPGSYTVTATLQSATHKGSNTASFTIGKKALTWAAGVVAPKTYDTTTAAIITTQPTLNGVINSDDVTVSAGTAAFSSANAGASVSITASGWGVGGTDAVFYAAPTGQPSFAAAAINKITLTWNTDGAVDNKTYNGSTAATIATQPTLNGVLGGDTVTITTGTAAFASANVASGITVTGSGWGTTAHQNYNAPTAQPTFAAANITKATTTGQPQTLQVVYGKADTYGYDLSALLPGLAAPAQLGTVTYTVDSVGGTTGIFSTQPATGSISGGNIALAVANVPQAQVGDTATVTVTVASTNYDTFNVVLTVKITDKTALAPAFTASGGTYSGAEHAISGLTFPKTDGSGTVTLNASQYSISYSGTTAGGTAYGPTATAPKDAGSYTVTVAVITADPTYTGQTTKGFTISQRALTLTATDVEVKVGGVLPTTWAYTVSGLAPSETEAQALATAPTVTCTAPNTTTAGSWPITLTGGTAKDNYTITNRVNGTFRVLVDYHFIDADSTHQTSLPKHTDKASDYAVRLNADYSKFFDGTNVIGRVLVNGTELTPGTHYTHAEGSTIITLKASYLATLANGTYTLEVYFADGKAELPFTVAYAANPPGNGGDGDSGAPAASTTPTGSSPQTGDSSNIGLWVVLILLSCSLTGVGLVLLYRNRKRAKR